ncbi:TPA: acyltransferase family protein [Escherichia coli]
MSIRNGNRLEFLDSLRGLAALMVACAHFIERTPLHNSFLFKHVNFGQVGVVCFFVLSDMVIPYSLKEGKRAISGFIISRFFRLYPAYWFSVFLAAFTFLFVTHRPLDIRTLLSNITMLQSLLRSPDMFGVYWTLIIELFFYASCAFLFKVNLLKSKVSLFLISIGLIATALAFSYVRFVLDKKVPVAIPLAMSLMFFGSLWRSVSIGIASRSERNMCIVFLITFLVAIAPICLMSYNKDYGHGENASSYIASYLTGIVLTLLLTTRVKLNVGLLVFLGSISYSVYLIHPFFLEIVSVSIDMDTDFNFIIFVLYLLATIALATISYKVIEKPSINIGHRLRKIALAS